MGSVQGGRLPDGKANKESAAEEIRDTALAEKSIRDSSGGAAVPKQK